MTLRSLLAASLGRRKRTMRSWPRWKLPAEAMEVGARARRLAEEYKSAQQRGEVKGHGGVRNFAIANENLELSAADLGSSLQNFTRPASS